jgi:DNA-binding NarL/FixJ family response regulator
MRGSWSPTCIPAGMRLSFESLPPPGGGPSVSGPPHVCVAGEISNDWNVVQRLKRHNQVTLVEHPADLVRSSALSTACVLALDCGDSPETGLITLALVARLYPRLRVLLVNGRLSQGEIAEAFRRGACDYLSSQVEPALTAERIESLCRRTVLDDRSLPQ